MSKELITAVVCTRDRAGMLSKCLDRLVRQSIEGQYEVLVVDNASSDATPSLVEQYAANHPQVHYLHEPVLGLSRARNCGLDQTRTPYVSYIDDDAVPHHDWLEQVLWAFTHEEQGPAVVGGEIDPAWEVPPPAWLDQTYWHLLSVSLGWSIEPRYLTEKEWLCEANISYQTEILRAAGGFPENLGRKGPVLLSGENFVNEIISHNGGKLFFNPRARVTHFVPKERLTPEWLRSRYFWGGVTSATVEKERSRLFGSDGKWSDVPLPASSWDWSDLINAQPDARLVKSFHMIYNVGYCLGRMGLFPL